MKGKLSSIILGALQLVDIYFAFIKSDSNDGKTNGTTKSLKSNDLNTQDPNPTQLNVQQPPVQNTTPANGEPDQYGRLPGDEHYGHNHPPQNQQQTIQPPTQQLNTQQPNLSGGPDKFGRNPGDEHYGHDHQ